MEIHKPEKTVLILKRGRGLQKTKCSFYAPLCLLSHDCVARRSSCPICIRIPLFDGSASLHSTLYYLHSACYHTTVWQGGLHVLFVYEYLYLMSLPHYTAHCTIYTLPVITRLCGKEDFMSYLYTNTSI